MFSVSTLLLFLSLQDWASYILSFQYAVRDRGRQRKRFKREIPPTGSGSEEECSCEPDRTDCRVEKETAGERKETLSVQTKA